MPEEKEFPTGLFVSAPRPNAPSFVKARISIKVEAFLEYLSQKDGEWLRIDVKEGFKEDEKTGLKRWYSQVDNWQKPSERATERAGFDRTAQVEEDDALPF